MSISLYHLPISYEYFSNVQGTNYLTQNYFIITFAYAIYLPLIENKLINSISSHLKLIIQ